MSDQLKLSFACDHPDVVRAKGKPAFCTSCGSRVCVDCHQSMPTSAFSFRCPSCRERWEYEEHIK